MGSGAGGVYSRTWGSAEGGQPHEKALSAVEMAAGMLLGDSLVDLAEALLRVAAGEPVEDVDFPDVSDVAFDLALDALSAFIPGGAAATRSLGAAARAAGKVGKGATKGVAAGEKAAVAESIVEYYGPAYPGIKAKLASGTSQLRHIFDSAAHHWEDTSSNRKRLEELVSKPQNYRGVDKRYGHVWYTNPEKDTPQIWAVVRGDTIIDGGINYELPEWSIETGYKASDVKRNNPKRKKGGWKR